MTIKVEHFDQSATRYRDRAYCSRTLIVNANTSYAKERKCRKHAQWKIDDHLTCSQHAGQMCLEYEWKGSYKE